MKTLNLQNFLYLKIPYQIVVYEIFQYLIIDGKKGMHPKDVAFYFKKDHLRTIFCWNILFKLDVEKLFQVNILIKSIEMSKKDEFIYQQMLNDIIYIRSFPLLERLNSVFFDIYMIKPILWDKLKKYNITVKECKNENPKNKFTDLIYIRKFYTEHIDELWPLDKWGFNQTLNVPITIVLTPERVDRGV